MAIERYILIVLPLVSSTILSKKRRQIFYGVIILLGFLFPILIFSHVAYVELFAVSIAEFFKLKTQAMVKKTIGMHVNNQNLDFKFDLRLV